jgi:hypothetical protein
VILISISSSRASNRFTLWDGRSHADRAFGGSFSEHDAASPLVWVGRIGSKIEEPLRGTIY